MREILLVGAGGFLGATLRYLLGGWVQRTAITARGMTFPLGTLAVNVLGCLLFGLLATLAADRLALGVEARLLLFTGVLGAFTTFSTFGYDAVALAQGERGGPDMFLALLYVGLHLALGLGAIWMGQQLAQMF